MRFIITLMVVGLATWSAQAQLQLSPKEWQEDLALLQQTVHQEYPFLFKKVSAEAFDQAVKELHNAIPELAQHEVVVGLARLVSMFGYGHTSLWVSGWSKDNPYGFRQMPYNLYNFSDGWYVQAVPQEYEAALGAKVLRVAGMSIEQALEAIRPVVPVENEQFFRAYGWQHLGSPEVLHAQGVTPELQETITLTLEKDGREFEQTFAAYEGEGYPGQYSQVLQADGWLSARGQGEMPLWLKDLDKIYYYEYLPEQKAVYVRHSQIQDDPSVTIPEFYAEVFDFIENNEVEQFILDVRLNGGGNNYKNKPIVTGVLETQKINQPGKFFVILGRRTFSACQNLVNELHTYTQAVFVGEPTSENINFYGDNRPVKLPNSGLEPRLSFAWWQDKPQWENQDWLAPHLAAELSFADYVANRDPVLETIWAYDYTDAIVDPMVYLEELFTTGKAEQIPAEAQRLMTDPRYQYYPFEENLNGAGYQLMGNGDVGSALFVFQLVAQLFPDSANAWDSLAEAHWKNGEIEKAKELYQKAISMDPDGSVGENARIMLEAIAKENKD
ncbi:MAG: tetratricopeptide repeat protein [Bacteroidota bacterium]